MALTDKAVTEYAYGFTNDKLDADDTCIHLGTDLDVTVTSEVDAEQPAVK